MFFRCICTYCTFILAHFLCLEHIVLVLMCLCLCSLYCTYTLHLTAWNWYSVYTILKSVWHYVCLGFKKLLGLDVFIIGNYFSFTKNYFVLNLNSTIVTLIWIGREFLLLLFVFLLVCWYHYWQCSSRFLLEKNMSKFLDLAYIQNFIYNSYYYC